MLELADLAFTIFHSLLILFNLTGWAFRRTRRVHLVVILLTLAAWLLIGAMVGNIGYCPLTDWQWQIKKELGQKGLPNSFTAYLLNNIFGLSLSRGVVDIISIVGLAFSLIMSLILNFIKLNKKNIKIKK